jgi:hypothetical protein
MQFIRFCWARKRHAAICTDGTMRRLVFCSRMALQTSGCRICASPMSGRRAVDFRDLAVAARVLRKTPVFALTATLTIALGVGASTAIFSVTNAVLLRPLPYRDPDRLVIACSDWRKRNVRDFPLRTPASSISERHQVHLPCPSWASQMLF